MKVVDLFSGAGGLSLGFDYCESFEVIYALDKWAVACATYKTNFPDVDVDCRDALDVKASEIPKSDIIIGGPPCQDFSTAKMSDREPNLSLVKWFLAVVDYHKPKYWIMENVEGVSQHLNVSYKIYKMNEYGVPQLRKRCFAGYYHEPEKYPINPIFPTVLASEEQWKSPEYVQIIAPRKNMRRLGLGLGSAFRRRSLLPEMKIIQTFPIDYVFHGTLKERYRQIGNAVPPLMAYRFAQAIENPVQLKISSVHLNGGQTE